MKLRPFRRRQPTLTLTDRSWELLWLVLLGWQDIISVRAPLSAFVGHQLTPFAGSKPTSATSESNVNVAKDSMPWQKEGSKGDAAREDFKVSVTRGCARWWFIFNICSRKRLAHATPQIVIWKERMLIIF